jgi:hypothetical protein
MENRPLPPELQRLERLLACGPRPEPSGALRQRVLGGVRSELRSKRIVLKWRVAAAVAATLLVGLSLSLGALQAAGFARQQRDVSPNVDEVALRLRQLSPGLSQEESLRQAVLRDIAAESSRQIPPGDFPSPRESHDP